MCTQTHTHTHTHIYIYIYNQLQLFLFIKYWLPEYMGGCFYIYIYIYSFKSILVDLYTDIEEC